MKTTTKTKLMREVKDAIRQPYAWPGGYPKTILLDDGEVICPECAKKEFKQICHDTLRDWKTGWQATAVTILWEGDDRCVQCQKDVTAYGDPNADQEGEGEVKV